MLHRLASVSGAFHDLPAEAVDLRRGDLAEMIIQGFAGFELRAVDQERPGPGTLAPIFIVV